MSKGWVKIHRKMTEWGWATDPNTAWLFITILMLANHKETKWRNKTINAGQLLTGIDQLSSKSGVSRQSVRTGLKRLISTGELTRKTYTKYSIITVTKWTDYQDTADKNTQEKTEINTLPTLNQHSTNSIQECKNVKNVKKKEIYIDFSDEKFTREKNILSWWNSFKIMNHRENVVCLEKIKKLLKKRKNYSDKEIFTAFENYSGILLGNQYIWSHKWTLFDFLQREKADKFFPDIFNTDLFPKKQSNAQTKQDHIMELLRGANELRNQED